MPLSVRHPRAILVLWLGAVAALAIVGIGADQRLHRTNVTIDGTPSARAEELAKRYFGDSQSLVIMLAGPRGEIDRQAGSLATRIERRPGIAVLGPWAPGASAALRPRADRTLILVRADHEFEHVSRSVVPALRADVRQIVRAPVSAHLSGYPDIANGLNSASIESLRRAELIAGLLLLLVLLAVFRSPIAAALPLALGLMTISAATGVLDLVNRVTPIDAVGLNMASMFGLALAVDYSLLIVSRFREEVAGGADVRAAAQYATRTAGRTVVFAGLTLGAAMIAATIIAPGTLLLSGGIGTITAVAIGVVGATTALPALLVLVGRHLDRWRLGRRRTRGSSRWSSALAWGIRRPLAAATLVLGLLLALSAPALAVKIGVPHPRALPESRLERQDFDAISRALPGGWMAPYDIVVASPRGAVTGTRELRILDRWQRRLAGQRHVRAVLGPAPIYDATRTAHRQLTDLRAEFGDGEAGLARLSRGLSRLDRGATQVRSGLSLASAGAAQLATGGDRADAGAAELQRGLARARSGSELLASALAAAGSGAEQLAESSVRAQDGAERIARAQRALAAGSDSGAAEVLELAARLRTGSQQLQRLREPVQTSEQDLRRARAALERMLPTSKLDPSYATAYGAVLHAMSVLSGRDARTGARVHPDYRGLDTELTSASGDAAEAGDAVARVAAGAERLAHDLDRLASGSRELADGLARVAAGNERLRASLARIAAAGQDLTHGLTALAAGGEELGAGLEPFRDGARRLESGLRSGMIESEALESGVRRMQGGVTARSSSLANGRQVVDSRVFASPYLTLAGLDAAPTRERAASTFAVNLERGGSATRLVVIDSDDPTERGNPLRDQLESEAQALSRQTGLQIAVGGPAAQLQDFADAAGSRLWLLMLVLALVSYAVLVPVLRSLVLPLLAVGLNVLTVGAAFGVLTPLFEGDAPLGGPGELDAIMVRAILSIVFALSIDYAVFLLARVREGYARTGTTEGALEYGLHHTASVITGAALIMIGVFVAFALSPVSSMRMLGVGLTIAVLLDATVVRLVLLPAAIRLIGRASWWLPAWLDRLLPEIDLESRPAPALERQAALV